MKNELVEKLFSISLKARILREWQKANRAQDQEFSERELLTLELINDFAPITEKGLCKIFGLSFSSVSDLIKNLAEKGVIDTSEKMRGKPLALTDSGLQTLERLKQMSAARLIYLFESQESSVTEQEAEIMLNIFKKIEKNAERHVQQLVFDRYPA